MSAARGLVPRVRDHLLVNFGGQVGDFLAQVLGQFGQLRVLLHQLQELGRLLRGQREPLRILHVERLAMERIGLRMGLVAVRLPRLRQQDQRRGVRGLQAEREIEQDERIEVEFPDADQVQADPDRDDDRLRDEEKRRAEKPGERLRLEGKPIVPERRREMQVRNVKPKMRTRLISGGGHGGVWVGLRDREFRLKFAENAGGLAKLSV